MSSINRCAAAALAGVFLANPALAGNGVEPTEERVVTPEIEAICAKADARYDELYPDAAPEDGVFVVKLYKYTFCPPNITVPPGSTVRWINVDKRTSHSVWLKQAGEAESERFFPDEVWSFTFDESGAYPYLCGPHWKDEDMYGHVTVAP